MTKVPGGHQPARRVLAVAVATWMAATVILSLLAWLFALGDSPVIHTTHVSLVQVVLTAGSVVSPPLILVVLAGLFLCWALSHRVWLSRAGTVLLLAGIAVIGWDTAGGLHARAAGYSTAKWDAVLVIGWAYVVVCLLAVLACIALTAAVAVTVAVRRCGVSDGLQSPAVMLARDRRECAGMPRYVALLRGINLGGRNKVAMADLRQVVASLGHTEVATYIQSGNVIFISPDADPVRLAEGLEQEIAGRLGVQSAVVVLSGEGLARVIADNPFPEETNPRCLHAVFRREEMGPDAVAAVAAAQQRAQDKGSRDEAVVIGRTLFLRTPGGLGRSELATQLARSGGQAAGTARNWATVTRLMAMLDVRRRP